MNEKEFALRLAQLRLSKGVSARDMSLSLGQNPGYINAIENGRTFPTMLNFFYICEFLGVTPKEFFDYQSSNPQESNELFEKISLLQPTQLEALTIIVNGLLSKKSRTK